MLFPAQTNMVRQMRTPSSRLVPLEAYRGLAALIVLVHHFFLAFAPIITGRLPELRDENSLIGSPWFVLVNGTAAVGFFFTLSGFVLSWSYFQNQDTESLRRAFLRRWPRLAGIVVISAVLSAIVYKSGLYYFSEAAQVSGSPWLSQQFNAVDKHPDLIRAAVHGATTFFTGNFSYNSNLWTMRPEFFGSMLVYMLAPFLLLVLHGRHLLLALFVLCASAAYVFSPMISFMCGTFLSFAFTRHKPVLSPLASWALLLLSLYCLGFREPIRYYAWVGMAPSHYVDLAETFIHTAGSAGLIFATMANQRIYRRLDNRYFALLGKLSFPIYLNQIVVIASASSFCYLYLQEVRISQSMVLVITFLCTLLGTLALSWPLEKFDAWWVGVVSRHIASHRAIAKQAPPQNQPADPA